MSQYKKKSYKVKDFSKRKYKVDKVTGLYVPEDNVSYLKNQPGREKTVARCHNIAHKGNLSVKLMKQHKCLRKQCPFFEKIKDHPYWADRD